MSLDLLKPGEPAREKLFELAGAVAEGCAVDSALTVAERDYLLDVQADVGETLFDALAEKLLEIPTFSDWCRERDIAQGADLDRDRSVA